eukprot:TRINITY_DN2494_c0_g1_i1.p1 TRINITY_DN2494_c0_g1~~TRINITY_DN2494_c0_g1_i1.p1  ORF type:complete len:187 (+),score=42.79 TRINITY_DN2494_c0_g1_i1:38-562(+)
MSSGQLSEEVRVSGVGGEEWVGVPLKKREDGVLVEETPVETKVVEEVKVEYVYHEMKGFETLPMLALQYNTTASAITITNGLLGTLDFVTPGTFLRIPSSARIDYTPEPRAPIDTKAVCIKTFIELTNYAVTREEAIFYLEENSYEVRAAFESRKADLAWEEANSATHSRKKTK